MTEELGDWSLSPEMYQYIREVLPEGSTILELGSGFGTSMLSEYYTMYSVEHDEDFLDRYNTIYFHVPLKEHKAIKNHEGTVWYDADVLRPLLNGLEYDLLLVDGPPESRAGFVKYFDMFDPDAIMVFDDVNRKRDNSVMNSIAAKLNVHYVTYGAGTEKLFGVINDSSKR
jgi:predicted O-methyltransferase YrrM